MAIYEKIRAAWDARDPEAYLALMDESCEFVRHQSGHVMTKADMADMFRRMMASEKMKISDHRLIYENDDILVTHTINDYPDDTREAVLLAYTLENGKIVRVETGATPLVT
jgi:uncharacterized protein (TIGR02246 family)